MMYDEELPTVSPSCYDCAHYRDGFCRHYDLELDCQGERSSHQVCHCGPSGVFFKKKTTSKSPGDLLPNFIKAVPLLVTLAIFVIKHTMCPEITYYEVFLPLSLYLLPLLFVLAIGIVVAVFFIPLFILCLIGGGLAVIAGAVIWLFQFIFCKKSK